MQKNVQISVLVVIAATAALLIAASSLAPSAFAKHHGIHIHISQKIHAENECSQANCQINAANVIQVGHDNSVSQENEH